MVYGGGERRYQVPGSRHQFISGRRGAVDGKILVKLYILHV